MLALCMASVSIAVLHTLCGPDHYVPFVAMSRAGRWSLRKTIAVTLLCGLGHVGSSVVLGFVGIMLGIMLGRLELIEQVRGNVAGWLMIGFGLAYLAWSGVQSYRRRVHEHCHTHADGTTHAHAHRHGLLALGRGLHMDSDDHTHAHGHSLRQAATGNQSDMPASGASHVTPWLLFTIFIFGPCEPLIPLLMYPASQSSWLGVAAVSIVFLIGTLTVMLATVVMLVQGAGAMQCQWLERHAHSMAGLVILLCGVTITLGL